MKHRFSSFKFLLPLPVIFLHFLVMSLFLKMVFIAENWHFLLPEGFGSMIWALFLGMRFDFSILAYLFIPGLVIFYAMIMTKARFAEWAFKGYFIGLAFFILVFWLADIQYFQEAGKHFTYEAFAYFNSTLPSIISGAFKLNPWLSVISVIFSLIYAWITGRIVTYCLKTFTPGAISRTVVYYVTTFIVILAALVVAARGGPQSPALRIGDSCISTSPYINAICLNPIYSALKSAGLSSARFEFRDEGSNVHTVRELLDLGLSSVVDKRYPLLRNSPGSEKGNRKNVVIFILESWTGKDIGALGSEKKISPFFDDLSRRGMLFTNFFATGIRTPEGVFSVLCSFPNQPLKPIMDRSIVYQTRWRSLSQILSEADYNSYFVHGASLRFDNLKKFLKYIGFRKVIDKRNLSSAPYNSPLGYHDEDVMRKADEEFSSQDGKPFLGVIYTIDTHPPFAVPEGFPELYPPTSIINKYYNAMRYTDHALETFFNLAKTKPYFQNTVFLFVSDHTRTRDKVNLFDQHHIPLLVYSPGYVQPGINPVVGGQLDILPTVLGLLQMKTSHSSWGRDLLDVPKDSGFAASVSGGEMRWHDSRYLLNDSFAGDPMLFDLARDKECKENIWLQQYAAGEIRKEKARSFISLSQRLMYENRVFPLSPRKP